MVKDNIMKLTDGMFHKMFRKVGESYPEIEKEVQIIDIGAARLAARPENYDVVVTLNLYGDIISDITAEIAGSVGLAGSANVGGNYAMFEAIHGSAPDIAGKNIANPSGLINASVMLLQHIGQTKTAEKIANALLRTLEDGFHTADVFNQEFSLKKVGTREFADAVIDRLGLQPQKLKAVSLGSEKINMNFPETKSTTAQKSLVGTDVFVDWKGKDADELGKLLQKAASGIMQLKMITNRGVKVFPAGNPETFCTNHWRCRFVSSNVDLTKSLNYEKVGAEKLISLQSNLLSHGVDVIKTENLYYFGEERGFSLGQGE